MRTVIQKGAQMTYDVFVSYSTQNSRVANRVRQRLEAEGMACWMAPWSIPDGQYYTGVIVDAIGSSRVMLLLLSPDANASNYVLREVEQAARNNLLIVAVVIEKTEVRPELRFYLDPIQQRVDAFAAPFRRWIDEVVKNIRKALDAATASSASMPPGARGQASLAADAKEVNEAWKGLVALPDALRAARTLTDSIVHSRSPYVSARTLPSDVHGGVQVLEARGFVRSQPSVTQPGERRLSFANPVVVQFALADWIELHLLPEGEFEIVSLLRAIEAWYLLSDGLARFIRQRWKRGGSRLFTDLLAHDGAPVAQTFDALATMLVEERRIFDDCLKKISADLSLDALSGLSLGAQRLLAQSQPDAAEQLYRALSAAGPPASTAPRRRLLDTIANELGRTLRRAGRLPEAQAHFEDLFARLEDAQDDELSGTVALNLAGTLLDVEPGAGPSTDRAIGLVERRLDQFGKPGQERNLAVAHHCLGGAYARRDPAAAERHFRRDVEVCRQFNDPEMLADALGCLGSHLCLTGRWREAKPIHREELKLCQSLVDDPRRLGLAHAHLARSLREQSRHLGNKPQNPEQNEKMEAALRRARDHYLKGWRLLAPLDRPRDVAAVAEAAGRLSYLLGELGQARELLDECIQQYRRWPEGAVIAAEIQAELDAVRW